MTTTLSPPPRVAVIGLGVQGTRIVDLLVSHGYMVLGGVDVGEKTGQSLRRYCTHADTPDVPVFATFDALAAARGVPDVAVFAAAVETPDGTAMAEALLAHGVNVLTLNEELFEGLGPYAERLDAVAKAHGVSIVATGLQDNLWVHLPLLAAASISHLERVTFDDLSNTAFFSADTGLMLAGMGLDAAAFDAWKQDMMVEPPVQGSSLREVARRLGFEPLDTHYDIVPAMATQPTWWQAAETEIPAGHALGARFLVSIKTRQGPVFEGRLTFKIAELGEIAQNSITLTGQTSMRIVLSDLHNASLTCLGILRRVEDVIAAPPGLVRAAAMAAPRYVHPVT